MTTKTTGAKCFWGAPDACNSTPLAADDLFSVGTDIFFNCVIDSASINKLEREIITVLKCAKSNTISDTSIFESGSKKIALRIVIDSPGGDVYEVLKFIDFIDIIKSQYPDFSYVSCIHGIGFSAATLMAIVADCRQMTKNASAMIHQMSLWNGGPINFLNQRMKHFNDLYEQLISIYVTKTKKDRQVIVDMLSKESWYNATQYLELGFIDKII